MRNYSAEEKKGRQKRPKVYRVKQAPFENPFKTEPLDRTLLDPPEASSHGPGFIDWKYDSATIVGLDALAEEEPVLSSASHPSTEAVARPPQAYARKRPTKQAKKAMSLAFALMLCVCIVVFTFSTFALVMEIIPRVQSMRNMKAVQEEVYKTGETITVSADDGTEESVIKTVDFASLLERNEEVVAWIRGQDSKIDFYVMQGDDNDKYLKKDIDKKSASGGSIFLDYRNSADFTDQNTVIYGHHMKDGTMFSALDKYKNWDKDAELPIITVFLARSDKIYQYRVFAVSQMPAAYAYRDREFGEDFYEVLSDIKTYDVLKSSKSNDPGPSDKILTLSTCTGNDNSARMVVFATLLNPDGKPRLY